MQCRRLRLSPHLEFGFEGVSVPGSLKFRERECGGRVCRLSRHQMLTKRRAGLPWAVGPWRGATAACPVGAGTRVRAAGVFARWWARCPAPFHGAAAAARFLWILLESSVPRQATLSLFLPDSCVSGSRCSHSLYLFCSMVYLGNSNTYKAALFFILSLNFLL